MNGENDTMKILTVAVPCYNSASYMDKCIESLLPGGEDIEILIIDDGSLKDNTLEVAREYEEKYPGIVRAIHQENKGHGGAVNTGIEHASGVYFKVVDSDDWVEPKALIKIIKRLKMLEERETPVDMLLANFCYDKQGAWRKNVMQFRRAFPQNRIISWDDMGHLKQTQYILMHNIIYRHSVLEKCGLKLPNHTFYVDNIFAFQPLPYCEKLYYMDLTLYHYFIGRDDQSVNEKVMLGRIDQQIRVNKIMIDVFTKQNWSGLDKNVRKYMMVYLNKIMTVTSVLLLVGGTSGDYEKKCDLWEYLKKKDEKLYMRLRLSFLGVLMNLPTKLGRKTTVRGYKIIRKFIHFN